MATVDITIWLDSERNVSLTLPTELTVTERTFIKTIINATLDVLPIVKDKNNAASDDSTN